jgi:hypothetical protein
MPLTPYIFIPKCAATITGTKHSEDGEYPSIYFKILPIFETPKGQNTLELIRTYVGRPTLHHQEITNLKNDENEFLQAIMNSDIEDESEGTIIWTLRYEKLTPLISLDFLSF